MTASVHPELDLAGTIRPGLDILANEIAIALKKRLRFKHNLPVYKPGLVRGQQELSLLDYELNASEKNHAELGRYNFSSQDAYTNIANVESIIDRETPASPVKPMPSGVGNKIIDFYLDWITASCESGDNASTYGETVTTDVLALLAIMERVNLGKAVAESKFLELKDQFIETKGDRDAMLQFIVRADREAQVLEIARQLARNYELPVEQTVDVFRFMISTTVDIEVGYLRLRIAQETSHEA